MRVYTIVFKEGLKRGLRPTEKSPRNLQSLVQSTGMIPEDGVCHALEDISSYAINTTALGAVFPFPQIFVLSMITLVFTSKNIYEWRAGSLTPLYMDAPEGGTWSVADYGRYLIMTNGACLITRDGESGEFSQYTGCDIPSCIGLCDVNGQLFIAAPGMSVGAGYTG